MSVAVIYGSAKGNTDERLIIISKLELVMFLISQILMQLNEFLR